MSELAENQKRFGLGNAALGFSIAGFAAICFCPLAHFFGYLALLSAVGLVLGAIGNFTGTRQRRAAFWGMVLGILGTLYLPTIWLSLAGKLA